MNIDTGKKGKHILTKSQSIKCTILSNIFTTSRRTSKHLLLLSALMLSPFGYFFNPNSFLVDPNVRPFSNDLARERVQNFSPNTIKLPRQVVYLN